MIAEGGRSGLLCKPLLLGVVSEKIKNFIFSFNSYNRRTPLEF